MFNLFCMRYKIIFFDLLARKFNIIEKKTLYFFDKFFNKLFSFFEKFNPPVPKGL